MVWFWKKKATEKQRYTFTDEDRETSSEIRNAKKELELLKIQRENELHKLRMEKAKLELQEEINELKGLYDDVEEYSDNEDGGVSELIKILVPLFVKNQTPASVVVSPPQVNNSDASITSSEPQKRSIPDEQLQDIWKNTPAIAKKFAKNASDDSLKVLLIKQLPDVDDDTIARALKIIRT